MDQAQSTALPDFETFVAALKGLHVSRVWQGYGSAIFVEFGKLHSTRKRDGQPGSPRGDFSLFIEWSWRIEGKRRIWCGSWSDGERWPRAFARLQDKAVTSVALFGRLPEIDVGLSNGLHLLSFMTCDGDLGWSISRRIDGATMSVGVSNGRLSWDERIGDRLS